MNGGILGQYGDAPFPFQVAGVHDPFRNDLIIPENAALAEHFIHQGGFAVVNVGDDRDIAQFHGDLSFLLLAGPVKTEVLYSHEKGIASLMTDKSSGKRNLPEADASGRKAAYCFRKTKSLLIR